MRVKIKLMVLAGAVLAVGLVGVRLNGAWHFRSIASVAPGPCTVVANVIGVEDITVDPNTGLAYLSVCDRRAVAEGRSADGGIYVCDLNRPQAQPIRIDNGQLIDFQPHGIDLFIRNGQAVALYVVNHGDGRHAVERFDVNGRRLVHRKTITGPQLVSPNDVAAVGVDRFYVTNDHGSRGKAGQTLEDYLGLKRSSVVYYDGSQLQMVAGEIGYANGIAVDKEGRRVLVAATTEGALRVYGREKDSGALVLQQVIVCGTAVDNLTVDPGGVLWIGAHPKPLHFLMHARSPAHRSPSEVLRLTIEPSGTVSRQTVFLDDGERLSGCSVGAVYKDRLLIGSVFEPFFLDCRMQSMPSQ